MKPANDQRAAIEHRGSSLLLSASAGSGKTEVLARRCVSLLLDHENRIDITRLLVLTFTRAAAAELRSRIGRALRGALDEGVDDASRDHIARQIALLDFAEIGTIDSWCQRIVREHSVELEIDPRFAVLSEYEHQLLRRETIETVFDWVCGSAEPLATASRNWIGRCADGFEASLREMVEQLNVFREHLLNPDEWLTAQRAATAVSDAQARADANRMISAEIADECSQQFGALGAVTQSPALDRYRELLMATVTGAQCGDSVITLCEQLGTFKWTLKGENAAAIPLCKEVKDKWHKQRLKNKFDALAVQRMLGDQALVNTRTATLLDLEARFAAELLRLKQLRNVYAFADIQRLAMRLLSTRPSGGRGALQPSATALMLRDQYEHVLIDECQDTSAVQMELLRLVTRPQPGRMNCFMVGDVKQSIYGFRQANPQLFAETMRAFEGDTSAGRLLHLTSSFRSHPQLLHTLNEWFATLFDNDFGGTQFGPREHLRAERDEIDNPSLSGRPRVVVHMLSNETEDSLESPDDQASNDNEDSGRDDAEDDRMEREARFIARQLKATLPTTMIPDRGASGGLTLRPARLGDCAILLRSAKVNALKVVSILRDEGVSAESVGREEFLSTTEGRDVLNVLRVIVNPRQDLALAAYLRSPLAGLGEKCLLAARRARPEGDFLTACREYGASTLDAAHRAQLERAFEQLERWSRAARDEDVAALLERVLRDTQYELFCLGAARGPQRVATLAALREFVRVFSAGPRGDAASFVAFVDQLEELDQPPQMTIFAGDDAVRVMTIHQAKGLEFPIVIVAGAGARFNDRSSRTPLVCDERVGVGLRFIDYAERREIIGVRHLIAARARMLRDREEELRLLYVAATRAREVLWIVGHSRPAQLHWDQQTGAGTVLSSFVRVNAKSMLDWVLMSVERIPRERVNQLFAVSSNEPPAIRQAERGTMHTVETAANARPAIANQEWCDIAIRAIALPQISPTAAVLSVSALKSFAHESPDEDRPDAPFEFEPELTVPIFAASVEADGRAVGIAVHRLLQHANLAAIATPNEVAHQRDHLVSAGLLSEIEAERIEPNDIAWLGQSSLGRLLSAHAGQLRREVPFVLLLDGPSDGANDRLGADSLLTRGVIDCLIDLPDRLILVDYKTDRIRDESTWRERIAAYSAQLSIYSEAARRIFGKPVEQAWLAFVSEHRTERITPSLDFLTRIHAQRV